MARRKKTEDGDAPGITHNSGDRRVLIQSAYQELERFENELAEIREARKSFKDEVIKGKLGMKTSDFMAGYRLYKLEGSDRDAMLDTIRECFDALGIGGQLDWVAAAERKKAARDDETAEAMAA